MARPTAGADRRVADLLIDILAHAGVEVAFGLPGGTIAPLFDALLDHPRIRVVTTRHESGAMFAAAGYAHATGRLGVVLVTSGPGVINAMTGLASAYCDGLPILLLAGEVSHKAYGKNALQEGSPHHLNIIGMARHITKLALEVPSASAAPALLHRAIATAMSGRKGPVAVTLPMNVTVASIRPPEIAVDASTGLAIPTWALDRAEHALAHGGDIAILAGSGVRSGQTPERLRELAEKLQCPVMTTPKGKGVFPEDHPLSLGVFGLGGHPSATAHLATGIDTLLAIGTSLGDVATNGWDNLLVPRRHFIHVDIESSQIGRGYPVDLGIAAPADLFLSRIIERVPAQPHRSFGIRYFAAPEEMTHGAENRIAPPRALWELQQALPQDTVFTCDSGEHFLFAVHYLCCRDPRGFMVMSGLGSMGSGICGALGAKLAHPGRTVAAVCGDGGFAMAAPEIATAVAQGLHVLFFVMNDGRLGMVELGNNSIYGRTPSYPTGPMDVSKLATSLGAQTFVVEHAGEILATDLQSMLARGPVVVDVHIDRTVRMPKHGRFESLGNTTRRRVMN